MSSPYQPLSGPNTNLEADSREALAGGLIAAVAVEPLEDGHRVADEGLDEHLRGP